MQESLAIARGRLKAADDMAKPVTLGMTARNSSREQHWTPAVITRTAITRTAVPTTSSGVPDPAEQHRAPAAERARIRLEIGLEGVLDRVATNNLANPSKKHTSTTVVDPSLARNSQLGDTRPVEVAREIPSSGCRIM